MIDTSTNKPLYVSAYGDAMPYIVVPVTQLENVTSLLDSHKVRYWVDEEALSLDGKPEITVINLNEGTNPAAVQSLLDSIP